MNLPKKNKHHSFFILVSFSLLFLVMGPSPAPGMTSQEFLDSMEVKMRETYDIFMEVRSHRVSKNLPPSDTMYATLAYRYPDQLLQWVRENGRNKQQILIKNGDSVVLSYPHIDVERRRSMTDEELRKQIIRNVPFVGLFVGAASGAVSADSITIAQDEDLWHVTYHRESNEGSRPVVEGWFTRKNLHPTSFIIQNQHGRYRIFVNRYTEEEGFPDPVEQALNQLQPDRLKGYIP